MIRIIAQFKRSSGNETVGDIWTETKSFNANTKISDIYKWVQEITHAQIGLSTDIKITIDQSSLPLAGGLIEWE
jgi:hypothetical protein